MNEDQKQCLAAAFRRVDALLAEAEARLAPPEAERLFAPCVADAAPVQRKVAADYARRVRAAMAGGLEHFGASSPRPALSGVWAARTKLLEAQIAAAELTPEFMRQHGSLAKDAERSFRAMVAEVWQLLDQMESYLAQGPGKTLRVRLQRMEASGEHPALLRQLERIVSDHGLFELRAPLEDLAERLESGKLEIAVLGRVNAGKSSLLNHVLQTAVLPVGVTPVTAIPVRIVHGPAPWGRVSFVDAAPEIFDLGRLAEFVGEQQNPSNIRHVCRVTVELPSPLLEAGIAFVDTPRFESVAIGCMAGTGARLPRCDLGLVLVDAASTLTEIDVELVDALLRSGAEAMVLLSKADLLEGQDLQRALSFVQHELGTRLQVEIPVHPVSVKGAPSLCDRWLEAALMPRLRDHRGQSTLALHRKLGILCDGARAALRKRLAAAAGGADALPQERQREIGRMLEQALVRLDAARRERVPELDRLAGLAHEALDEAAHNAAIIWTQSHGTSSDVTALIESSVQSRAGVAAAAAARQFAELRTLVRATLAEACSEALAGKGRDCDSEGELPQSAGAPVLDGASVVPRTVLQRPALAIAGAAVLKRGILGQIEALKLEQRIVGAFQAYARRLDAWRESMLDDLRREFIARRESLQKAQNPDDGLERGAMSDAVEAILADLRQIDKMCTPKFADPASDRRAS